MFFYIEGGHLLKVNWLTETLIKIDHMVYKAIQLFKRCQSKVFENMKILLQKENCYGILLCFINMDVRCEKTKKALRWCIF